MKILEQTNHFGKEFFLFDFLSRYLLFSYYDWNKKINNFEIKMINKKFLFPGKKVLVRIIIKKLF